MTKKSNNNETKQPDEDQKPFSDLNITLKTGNLVKDAELVGEGKIVRFRIASNKSFKSSDGEVTILTNYFNVLVSGKLKDAFETAKNLKKGDWVYLKGEDSTKLFDTAEGYTQCASTIFAYKVVLKKEKEQTAEPA